MGVWDGDIRGPVPRDYTGRRPWTEIDWMKEGGTGGRRGVWDGAQGAWGCPGGAAGQVHVPLAKISGLWALWGSGSLVTPF